jgi:hypothetical protein
MSREEYREVLNKVLEQHDLPKIEKERGDDREKPWKEASPA